MIISDMIYLHTHKHICFMPSTIFCLAYCYGKVCICFIGGGSIVCFVCSFIGLKLENQAHILCFCPVNGTNDHDCFHSICCCYCGVLNKGYLIKMKWKIISLMLLLFTVLFFFKELFSSTAYYIGCIICFVCAYNKEQTLKYNKNNNVDLSSILFVYLVGLLLCIEFF